VAFVGGQRVAGNVALRGDVPIGVDVDPDRDEAVRRATAKYMAVTEAAIRKQPSAWLWAHDRWRTRPEESVSRSQ